MISMPSRLSELVSWGFVISVFSMGYAWNDIRADVTEAEQQTELAMTIGRSNAEAIIEMRKDRDEDRRRMESIEREQCMARWVNYRVLRKVDPGSVTMMPEPQAPHECKR